MREGTTKEFRLIFELAFEPGALGKLRQRGRKIETSLEHVMSPLPPKKGTKEYSGMIVVSLS